jgi:galactose oxidase
VLKPLLFVVPGGGLSGGCTCNHRDFEILTPPYLLNANGTPAIRPVIQSSPTTANAGDAITVTLDTDGSHTFALIKASAVTHSVNNDQRRVPLDVASQSGTTFSIQIPSSTNVVLPGFYFLFAMNVNGVPSVGATIRVG